MLRRSGYGVVCGLGVALLAPGWTSAESPAATESAATGTPAAVKSTVVQPTVATPAGDATLAGTVTTTAREATHKQIRSLRPTHNGQPIHLNTYCLSPEGNILACVGGSNFTYQRTADGNYAAEQTTSDSFVQVYNPEGQLLHEWPVPFKPTAINVAPDQTIFVAGAGRIARLSKQGEVLTTAAIPNVGDPEKFAAEAAALAKQQQAEALARLEQQIELATTQINKLNEIPESERSASQKARITAYQRQLAAYQDQLATLQRQATAAPSIATRSGAVTVTALAVSSSHVFVCANSVRSGGGYDVFRCDFDFQNPQQVLTGLRGCCGQMDIQATADRLVTAENTKFVVGIYDEDGKSLDSFGSRDRTGGAGFGSCCNPMNVRCCANGDVLTAESSIGDIKRFSADGEYLAYVGRAKISGGCKHVAIAWDPKLDRYYMMNVSDNSICVLVPKSEAPEFTEDELAAKAAREGLGQKLVGAWKLPGTKVAAPKKRSALAAAVGALLGAADENENSRNTQVAFERVEFAPEGGLHIAGGMYGQYGVTNWTWSAVKQDEIRQTIDFEMQTDGIQYQTFRVELLDAERAKISILNSGSLLMTGEYVRDTGDAAPASEDQAVPAQDVRVISESP